MNLDTLEVEKIDSETMQVRLYLDDETELCFPVEFETEQVEEEFPESHNPFNDSITFGSEIYIELKSFEVTGFAKDFLKIENLPLEVQKKIEEEIKNVLGI